MNPPYELDDSSSFLSAFDISGSLLLNNSPWQSKGNQHDIDQLMKDQKKLEQDYKTAYETVMKEQETKR